jgi:hypothetical protein
MLLGADAPAALEDRPMTDTNHDDLDAPLDAPGAARPDADARTPDDPDAESLPEVLTREGADAPDAADIADPDEQL